MARLSAEHYSAAGTATPDSSGKASRFRDLFRSRSGTTPESSTSTLDSHTSPTVKPGFKKVGMHPNERTNNLGGYIKGETLMQHELSHSPESQRMHTGDSVSSLLISDIMDVMMYDFEAETLRYLQSEIGEASIQPTVKGLGSKPDEWSAPGHHSGTKTGDERITCEQFLSGCDDKIKDAGQPDRDQNSFHHELQTEEGHDAPVSSPTIPFNVAHEPNDEANLDKSPSERTSDACGNNKITQEIRDHIANEVNEILADHNIAKAVKDTKVYQSPSISFNINFYGIGERKTQDINQPSMSEFKLLKGKRAIGPYYFNDSKSSSAQFIVISIYMMAILFSIIGGAFALLNMLATHAVLLAVYLAAGEIFGWEIDTQTDILISPVSFLAHCMRTKIMYAVRGSVKMMLKIVVEESLESVTRTAVVAVD